MIAHFGRRLFDTDSWTSVQSATFNPPLIMFVYKKKAIIVYYTRLLFKHFSALCNRFSSQNKLHSATLYIRPTKCQIILIDFPTTGLGNYFMVFNLRRINQYLR